MNKGIAFVGIGFELVGLVLGGVIVGRIVDHEMNWPGYGVMGFIVVGLVSWLTHLVFLAKKYMKDNESDDETQNNT